MTNAILTGITAYLATGIDYLLILMTILGIYTSNHDRLKVYWGDVLGTTVLVSISLVVSISARLIPAEWILGLLGIVPILIGLYILKQLHHSDEQADVVKKLSQNKVLLSVMVITITTCGADNLGIYVPIFTQVGHWSELVIILLTFFIMLNLFFGLAILFVKIPFIEKILAKYGDVFTAVVYIGIGLFILIEAGTISHLIGI